MLKLLPYIENDENARSLKDFRMFVVFDKNDQELPVIKIVFSILQLFKQ